MKDSRIGAKTEAIIEYEAALLRLNDLMAQDQDESLEGELLRDDLERLHWRLSDSEKERMGGLSADLYMLQDNEVFEVTEYERLLIQLHDLLTEGKGDTDEADAVREAMELPERQLTRAGLSLLNGLSADLYMLQDDEIFETRGEGETEATVETKLRTAWERQQWDVALSLLRKNPASLTTEGLATLRAHAYDQLSLRESARRFQQKAAELTLRRWLPAGNSAALTPLK